MNEEEFDKLDDELCEVWNKLRKMADLQESILKEAYSRYGEAILIGSDEKTCIDLKERAYFDKGVFDGWDSACNLLSKSIDELLDKFISKEEESKNEKEV